MSQVVKLTEVRAEPKGSPLVAAASVGASTLTIDYAGDFAGSGGTLDLNGTQLAYTSITEGTNPTDPDVINLAANLLVGAAVGDWVGTVDGGQALVDYWAVCATDDGDQIMVPITDQQIPVYKVGPYDPPAPVIVSDDQEVLESAPGRTPTLSATGTGIQVRTIELPSGGTHEDASAPATIASANTNISGTVFSHFLRLFSPGMLDDSGVPYSFSKAVLQLISIWNSTSDTASTKISITADSVSLSGATDLDGALSTTGDISSATNIQATGNIAAGGTISSTGNISAPNLPKMASGTATINISAAASGSVVANFGTTFASAPRVVATLGGGTINYIASIGTVTTSQVTLFGFHRAGTSGTISLTVNWIAML